MGSGVTGQTGAKHGTQINPETGQQYGYMPRFWSGMTGKHPPTPPQLPREIAWMAPAMQDLYGAARPFLDMSPLGPTPGGIAADRLIGAMDSTSMAEGYARGQATMEDLTGPDAFARNFAEFDAALDPYYGIREERGMADVREQQALTGNLIGTGSGRMTTDFLRDLEGERAQEVFGAIPEFLDLQRGAADALMRAPGMVSSSLFEPGAGRSFGQEQYNQGFPLQAITSVLSAAGASPFYASQGSNGGGGFGSALGAYMSSQGGSGGGGKKGSGGGGVSSALTTVM